jgi:molybdate transport system substrate-binding protein
MPIIQSAFSKISAEECQVTFGTTVSLVAQCTKGHLADAVILTHAGIEELVEQNLLLTSSITPFAKTGIGIAVAKNASQVDISSPEKCLKALLNCQSIAFTQFGASGLYFSKLIQKLGIEHAILAKSIRPEGGLVAKLVLDRQVEMAVQLVSEIKAVPEVDLLGFLPEELQEWSIFSIAQTANSTHPKIALLRDVLKSPPIQEELKLFGFID